MGKLDNLVGLISAFRSGFHIIGCPFASPQQRTLTVR